MASLDCYLEDVPFILHNEKHDGYPNSNRLRVQGSNTFFLDGDEFKYELWVVYFQGNLRI